MENVCEYSESDLEFVEQKDLADKRIEHMKIVQDKLRTHISTIESINSILENKANSTKSPDEKIKLAKSISFNYERLIKLYDAYQSYEQIIQRYYSNITDIITRKYKTRVDLGKVKEPDNQKEFFRQLNNVLCNSKSEDVQELTKIEDDMFKL